VGLGIQKKSHGKPSVGPISVRQSRWPGPERGGLDNILAAARCGHAGHAGESDSRLGQVAAAAEAGADQDYFQIGSGIVTSTPNDSESESLNSIQAASAAGPVTVPVTRNCQPVE
jgi:hypothetical protein